MRRATKDGSRGFSVRWVLAVGAVLLIGAGVGVGGAGVRETFSYQGTTGVDPAEYFIQQQVLHGWLVAEMPEEILDRPISIRVTPEDMAEVDRVDAADPGRTTVGLTKPVGQRVVFNGLRLEPGTQKPHAGGVVRATEDGGFVWSIALRSAGANGLRVGFADGRLPDAADLYVFNMEGQAFGPYTGRDFDADGELWSNTVRGPLAIVQLHLYGPVTPRELRSAGFTISQLGHIGPKFLPLAGGTAQEAFCTYNEPCIENAECHNIPAAIETNRDAIGLMLWISGAFINTCTGGLLADTSMSETPYFLTANHCISRGKDARNLNTFFQYSTNGCSNNCPPEWQGGGIQVTPTGASIQSTSSTSDYTLLELNGTPPTGSVFMGWTTAAVANSNGTPLYRISHPATAPQAYSTQEVDTSAGTCQGIPRGAWIYSRDTLGATEGGSSGSPVCNSSGQVVGQLTGACGFNPGDACDNVSNATIDGAFAAYFSNIAQYLDPSPCQPTGPEVCDNGADDDCDGATDCDDSDCTGDPACASGCVNPGGLPVGSSCNSNADCCSNKCKGGPNNKSCK